MRVFLLFFSSAWQKGLNPPHPLACKQTCFVLFRVFKKAARPPADPPPRLQASLFECLYWDQISKTLVPDPPPSPPLLIYQCWNTKHKKCNECNHDFFSRFARCRIGPSFDPSGMGGRWDKAGASYYSRGGRKVRWPL